MKSTLVIFCLQNQLAAWRLGRSHAPQRVLIDSQELLPLPTPATAQALAQACADIAERLHGEGFAIDEVHWILDAPGNALWQTSLPLLQQIFTQHNVWQNLSWPWLAARFGLDATQPWATPAVWAKGLLPWLVTLDRNAEQQQMQQALARDHQTQSEQLLAERTRLQQENEQLRHQNAALHQVDAENLLRFLPALFARVFVVLGATDLALLSGRVEPLAIPNPYPEPSEETLRTLQKHFRALPLPLQQQIVRFVAHLPQRQKLQPRPEMRELVQALEEN
ncbi:MAG: hypothetical protein PHX60_03350 [Giesbergeria sp.]|uniref:hypothetical protein n=1 Tax=Giesbergeria sp. TaxID=2818473 RepID=UPI00260D1D32|nr:hypothetical protein [Giesbergeria sp.]MDD2608717.1 hypothetical protein [Giesbergeria sp.]